MHVYNYVRTNIREYICMCELYIYVCMYENIHVRMNVFSTNVRIYVCMYVFLCL